jgi:cobalamin biosynthesis protein CobT
VPPLRRGLGAAKKGGKQPRVSGGPDSDSGSFKSLAFEAESDDDDIDKQEAREQEEERSEGEEKSEESEEQSETECEKERETNKKEDKKKEPEFSDISEDEMEQGFVSKHCTAASVLHFISYRMLH